MRVVPGADVAPLCFHCRVVFRSVGVPQLRDPMLPLRHPVAALSGWSCLTVVDMVVPPGKCLELLEHSREWSR